MRTVYTYTHVDTQNLVPILRLTEFYYHAVVRWLQTPQKKVYLSLLLSSICLSLLCVQSSFQVSFDGSNTSRRHVSITSQAETRNRTSPATRSGTPSNTALASASHRSIVWWACSDTFETRSGVRTRLETRHWLGHRVGHCVVGVFGHASSLAEWFGHVRGARSGHTGIWF